MAEKDSAVKILLQKRIEKQAKEANELWMKALRTAEQHRELTEIYEELAELDPESEQLKSIDERIKALEKENVEANEKRQALVWRLQENQELYETLCPEDTEEKTDKKA
jgi:hypothetical protein